MAKFKRDRAIWYYQSIYIRGMAYSLPATSLTKHELQKIRSPFTRELLHRLKFPNSFPSALVYAPIWMSGLRLLMLYGIQGAEKCMLLLQHLRMNHSTLANTLAVALNLMHLYAGTSSPPPLAMFI